jgi:DNA modification methylase
VGAYYADDLVTLHHGDAAAVAATLAPRSVRTIVTSPPYFGLRDYGEAEQIGAEETLQEYVDRLVGVFRALRDVLTDDGTLWLNLGDSYGVDKNLLMVPARVALALQEDGWILRSDTIWAKRNPMPDGAIDRPTKAHEYLFLLAKSPRYYYDSDAIAEPMDAENVLHVARYGANPSRTKANPDRNDKGGDGTQAGFSKPGATTRNKRSVWSVSTQPFPGAHFAVYPPELIRPCILAGSAPGDTVLDPFSGSGTTGQVATQEGRRYVGIDLNRDYLDLSLRTRFAQPVLNFGAHDE